MPRRPRQEVAGGLHHVTAHAAAGRLLFRTGDDARRYLVALGVVVQRHRWRLLTYCLMPNHLHLLVHTPEANLGAGMKWLQHGFALEQNRREALSGHLFRERFFNGVVRDERHRVGCLRYIARNPVKARISATAAEYPWSAHRALLGEEPAPHWLDAERALEGVGRDAYRRLVDASNAALLPALEDREDDAWLVRAVDDYTIDVPAIAAYLQCSVATVYRRLAAVRMR